MRENQAEELANVSPLLPVKLVFMSERKSVKGTDALSTSNRRPGKAARILEMIKAPETFAIKLNYDF